MVSDNFMDDWEAASYDVGPCQDCDQKLDLMVEEYDKYGTHYFNENSFCCSSGMVSTKGTISFLRLVIPSATCWAEVDT